MSQAVNLVGKSVVHGSGLTEGKYLPCAGVSGRALTVNPCCSRISYGPHSQVVWPLRCASVGPTFVCGASPNNNNNGAYNRRNPDYPRQNKQGFSRGRNNNNRNQSDERERDRDREKDGFESLEDSDILSSKNGPYVSLSNSPKFHATATPGPREKEIVELFRKVQAQLRERAAFRDEKRNESAQGQGKDNETVDSLLKLLRKHSTEQAKRSSSSRDSSSDHQQGHNGQYIRGKSTGSTNSSNSTGARYSGQDSISSSSSSPRPASSFQRRSPIHRTNFQAVDEGTGNSVARVDSGGKGKIKDIIPEADLGLEFDDDEDSESESEADEPELVQLLEADLSNAEEAVIDDESDDDDEEDEEEEEEDLSSWKLAELRALAKSRGMKGYSKMKKSDLVDLLSGASV